MGQRTPTLGSDPEPQVEAKVRVPVAPREPETKLVVWGWIGSEVVLHDATNLECRPQLREAKPGEAL